MSVLAIIAAWGLSACGAVWLAAWSMNENITRIVGFGACACLGVAFYFLFRRERRSVLLASILALAPAPALIAIVFAAAGIDEYIVPIIEAPPSEYTTACTDAGEHFYRFPSKPVHSIAFDVQAVVTRYKTRRYAGLDLINGYEISFSPRFGNAIQFIDVRQSGKAVRYRRIWTMSSSSRKHVTDNFVTATSADVLVSYHIYPKKELAKVPIEQGPVIHELTVTDRRDGALLATMKYVVDKKDGRICGPIHNHVLSEKEFLVKALNLH